MAKQTIFLGTVAGDHTGTKLRLGGDMINDNFDELYAAEALNTAKTTNQTHTGEVTGSVALTITNKAVTLAKMNDVASGTVFYRKTAGTGTPEVQTILQLALDLITASGFTRRYTQVIDISAGITTTVITTITEKPYSVQFWDSSGNLLNSSIDIEEAIIDGYYAYNLYSTEAMTNVELRITY